MRPLFDKYFSDSSRFEYLFLLVPFLCWLYCFFNFFNGHLWLEADATSYADHITFYTDNLCKGVYPLWDPAWFGGAPYHFFLRRIGDVNPFLFLIVLLKWFGVPSAGAFLMFFGFYYFLAGWAIYLIARFLLVDRFYAFIAYILFLFSSWGSEIFYNYIIIIFVPIVWFFYFLLCFSRSAQKGFFLGMCLCVGLIITTYIPFFFLTILAIFTFFYLLFYWQTFWGFLNTCSIFFLKNKIFTVFCIFFLLCASIPALIFYKETKSGEFVLPSRHAGSETSSAVEVGIGNVQSGDIISHGYFDRIFDDQAHIDMGDIYLPFIFFLVLFSSVLARSSKLIYFLLFNVLSLSLITITSAAGVHRFLYDHLIIFRFIRNIYYFFWLAMLPMGILLGVCAFKSLLVTINASSKKITWLVYIVVCHLLFVLFLLQHQGILWGAWVSIFISLVYFIIYFKFDNKISYPAGFFLLLLAVFIQSAQLYDRLDDKLFQYQNESVHSSQINEATVEKSRLLGFNSIKNTILDPNNKNGIWENVSSTGLRFKLNYPLNWETARRISKDDWGKLWPLLQGPFNYPPKSRMELYYSTHWFAVVVKFLDPKVLVGYTYDKFILYDNVVPYIDSPEFFDTFQKTIANNTNIAYIPKFESDPSEWKSDPDALPQADVDPVGSGKLTVSPSDVNTWILNTHLANRQFLVINDNYYTGWHASINGQPVHLLRANVSFKGLWVPQGDSKIVLHFKSPVHYLFHISLLALFAGTFVYLLILLIKRKEIMPYA